MITTHLHYETDLDRDPVKVIIPNLLHTDDQSAHQVCVAAYQGTSRQAVDLSGAHITGYFIRADQTTVLLSGAVENGAAVCTLPQACYSRPGSFSLLMKATMNGVIHTIFHGSGMVVRSRTDAVVDPEGVLPSLDELQEIVARVEKLANLTVSAQTLSPGSEATAAYADGVLTLGLPKGDMGAQQPSDWNECDPTAPSHIRNRTHWTETGLLTLLPETDFVKDGDSGWILTVKPSGMPEDGTECTVTWNGTDFTCTAVHTLMEGIPIVMLGNLAAMGGNDTGEPFIMIFINDDSYADQADGTYAMGMDLTGGAATFTVKIEGMGQIVHTLDEKYLPASVRSKVKEKLNLVNGQAEGSMRSPYALEESAESYSLLGISAFALGVDSRACGDGSFALGSNSTANGSNSVTEGDSTVAQGAWSHAEGYGSEAIGARTHAEGLRTLAEGMNQHVQGKYNISDPANKYAHIVGNGISHTKRSNAHTLDWNGNAWFAGTMEGTAVILTSPGGTRYQVTVSDDGTLSATAL